MDDGFSGVDGALADGNLGSRRSFKWGNENEVMRKVSDSIV